MGREGGDAVGSAYTGRKRIDYHLQVTLVREKIERDGDNSSLESRT